MSIEQQIVSALLNGDREEQDELLCMIETECGIDKRIEWEQMLIRMGKRNSFE